MAMIRVILCDDHALIRRGIRDTLSDAPDIEVVGEAGDYGELRALRAGAFGYVNKGGDPQTLVSAVRTVAQGRKYVTPEIAQMLVESLTTPVNESPHERLSDRELQTLVMIASGKRLSDIAEELKLSPKTVSVYRARVLEKLSLHNNSELTVYAIRNGLVGS